MPKDSKDKSVKVKELTSNCERQHPTSRVHKASTYHTPQPQNLLLRMPRPGIRFHTLHHDEHVLPPLAPGAEQLIIMTLQPKQLVPFALRQKSRVVLFQHPHKRAHRGWQGPRIQASVEFTFQFVELLPCAGLAFLAHRKISDIRSQTYTNPLPSGDKHTFPQNLTTLHPPQTFNTPPMPTIPLRILGSWGD